MDYNSWHAALGHAFKATVNRKVHKDGFVILDCLSKFSCNLFALSKSKHIVPQPVESKSIEVFEVIYPDSCGPFLNESYTSSKYFFNWY
jgi:hypothetical protein